MAERNSTNGNDALPETGDERVGGEGEGREQPPSGESHAPGDAAAAAPRRRRRRRGGRSHRRRRGAGGGGGAAPTKEMLINVLEEGEVRIAIVSGGKLENLFVEREFNREAAGNIYKGKIVSLSPELQAAFVDIGTPRNAFLHIDDTIFPDGGYQDILKGARKKKGRGAFNSREPRIEDIFEKGQEVLLQITREAIGSKCPSATNFISMPGRYLVAMPASKRLGVSRKIIDEEKRSRLKGLLKRLNPPDDLGFIVRTAGMDKGEDELRNDLEFLSTLWKSLQKKIKSAKAPALIYEDSDLVVRTVRDFFTEDIGKIWVDSKEVCDRLRGFFEESMPKLMKNLTLYKDSEPIFGRFRIETEFDKIFQKKVSLATGGSIFIETTEGMVSIDVNTGRAKGGDTEEIALKTNLDAADEIARQLRLRDIGGLVIIDFVDMAERANGRRLEDALRAALASDKARTQVLPLSEFGVIEMTRQRVRSGVRKTVYRDCPCCKGSGMVKSPESLWFDIYRAMKALVHKERVRRILVSLNPEDAAHVTNAYRRTVAEFEQSSGALVEFLPDPAMFAGGVRMESIK